MEEKIFCVMCKNEVPADRLKRRSITCTDECAKARTRYLHRRVAKKKCRYCMQPATPSEQAMFKAWRRTLPKDENGKPMLPFAEESTSDAQ